MHEKQSPSNKENVKALQVAPPSISFQWLILYNMFLESGFFVDCFFLSYSKTTHTACVRWNEARKKVHALPSFKNTGTSQVFHTSWMHFPFSCWHKRTSCKSCNDLQLWGTLHSLGRQTSYSACYMIPTLNGYVTTQKVSSFERVSCLEIRNDYTQGNGVIQLWNWCEERVLSTDLIGVLAAVVSKKGAGFPCYYWIYTISQPSCCEGLWNSPRWN